MQGEGETDPCRGRRLIHARGETGPCRGEGTDPCRGRGRLIHAGGGD